MQPQPLAPAEMTSALAFAFLDVHPGRHVHNMMRKICLTSRASTKKSLQQVEGWYADHWTAQGTIV